MEKFSLSKMNNVHRGQKPISHKNGPYIWMVGGMDLGFCFELFS